jgi:hypothetical protein
MNPPDLDAIEQRADYYGLHGVMQQWRVYHDLLTVLAYARHLEQQLAAAAEARR